MGPINNVVKSNFVFNSFQQIAGMCWERTHVRRYLLGVLSGEKTRGCLSALRGCRLSESFMLLEMNRCFRVC